MKLGHAFTYIFDDQDWVGKIIIVMVLTFATALLMPFFFLGLVPLAILLGYTVELVANVRDNTANPLPKWGDYGQTLSKGVPVLTAMVAYNLPAIVLTSCFWLIPSLFTDEIATGFFTLILVCCLLPFVIIYTAVTWTMLAVGVVHYARSGQAGEFYKVSTLLDTARDMGTVTFGWILASIAINIIFGLIYIVPCLGWIAGAGLSIPVHGHLLGQYARKIKARRLNKTGQ